MIKIGEYDIVEKIRSGNHGTFFTARPPEHLGVDADLVALKVLDPHASENELKRMAAELGVLLQLDNPYLVTVLDAGQDRGRLFYATRFFTEGSMMPGPGNRVAEVATQVADAAEAAHALHEVGVSHRDIKPGNILLADGRGHLSDLGVARFSDAEFTTTGSSPVGTLGFTDPELIRGGIPGRACDIWSLGATLHLAVTGRSIIGDIPDVHLAAAIEHILNARAQIDPRCPSAVAAVVARATQANPVDRYRTASEMAAELRRVAGGPQAQTRSSSAAASGSGLPIEQGHQPPAGVLLDRSGGSHLLRRNTVVGRQPDVDGQVTQGLSTPLAFTSDSTMSRAHLRIELRRGDVYVTDISSNGSRIRSGQGARPVPLVRGEPTVLYDGDVLLGGGTTLTFHSHLNERSGVASPGTIWVRGPGVC